jgi:hypothetical protein
LPWEAKRHLIAASDRSYDVPFLQKGVLMFRLLTSISTGELFKRQLPVFLVAFVIAELFYKFHSFTLECAAFLGTWFVLDGALHLLTGRRSQKRFPN